MFYNLNLDDRSYREIEEDAVFQIPGECPDWTNYNQSDPGIMLLGLLSWLKEIQQYQISQLGGWKRQKYLKLFGIKMGHIQPARGYVSVEMPVLSLKKNFSLRKGTRFFAGDMPFETVKKEWLHPIRLMGAYILCGKTLDKYVNIGNDLGKKMRLYPFGEQPKEGNSCCFVMDRAFRQQGQTVISFDICTDYEVMRNPIGEDFISLAKLKWEYQSLEGWEELPVDFDTTYAFLQSGKIAFHLPGKMVEDEVYEAWQIRVTLVENDYDVAPLIENIHFNEIEVRQQYSCCDYEEHQIAVTGAEEILSVRGSLYLAKKGQTELYLKRREGWIPVSIVSKKEAEDGDVILYFFRPDWAEGEKELTCRLAAYENEFWEKRKLARGDGFASQEYRLDLTGIVYDQFEIMVCDRQDGKFYTYRKVEDFDNSAPEDAVYVLDLAENKLIFGDCEHGMAPDGEIRLVRLKASDGRAGNIKAGKISECPEFPELLVKQYDMTLEGQDNETVEECYERLRLELRQIHRGVTDEDYETLVKQTPGLLILDSKVISPGAGRGKRDALPENEISIVVRSLSYKEREDRLNDKYRKNLEQMLQKRKMIGTSIKIWNPEYVGISIFAEIVIKPQFTDAEDRIEEAVRDYLDEKSWEIGKTVSSSAIYGIIDILPCVQQARALSVEARGRGFRHLMNGDVQLPPNGLPYLKDLDIRVFTVSETGVF
ncbi:MAG: hypothetical protein HFH41_11395 [Lachnospiraceae bacterium]|nr:hypothetical protein [Lachnospiraceae bacterium]